MSYTRHVLVDVFGYRIQLGKGRSIVIGELIKADNVHLMVSLVSSLSLIQRFHSVILRFIEVILFDGEWIKHILARTTIRISSQDKTNLFHLCRLW